MGRIACEVEAASGGKPYLESVWLEYAVKRWAIRSAETASWHHSGQPLFREIIFPSVYLIKYRNQRYSSLCYKTLCYPQQVVFFFF